MSGNPLTGRVCAEIVARGGVAELAETDELIGAEKYVLSNVVDYPTAKRFLDVVERFKERAKWHNTSAEGNPSGGNMYRVRAVCQYAGLTMVLGAVQHCPEIVGCRHEESA